MSRTFVFARKSVAGQTSKSQARELAAAAFAVGPHRVVGATLPRLADIGVRFYSLALAEVDSPGAAGKVTMGAINAVTQFGRGLPVERTRSGLARARAEGKPLGCPP